MEHALDLICNLCTRRHTIALRWSGACWVFDLDELAECCRAAAQVHLNAAIQVLEREPTDRKQ